ncbi:MAG: hypothetical protein H5U07_10645 [Candidatus Aminicenantes bacterium]|nr:hypothetical protein [Candidatus Aminicenantes bacterium]
MKKLRCSILWWLFFYFLAGGLLSPALSAKEKEKPGLGNTVGSSLPLKLSGYAQLQLSEKNTENLTFFINRARFSLAGALTRWLRFKLQADVAKSPVLRDALAEVILSEKINLRLGQFIVPFGLENTTSAGELLTINRSQTVDLLAPGRDNAAAGRDQGVMLFGHYSVFEYHLGLFNGSGINRKDDNDHKDFSFRVLLRAAPGLKAGFSVYQGRKRAAENTTNLVRNKYGLEASFTRERFLLNAEYLRATDGQQKKQGGYVLLAYSVKPEKLQLIGRLETVNLDLSLAGQKSTVYTAGVNWFITSKSKLQINYEYHDRQADANIRAFLVQLQVGF